MDWRWPAHLEKLKVTDVLILTCVITLEGKVRECDPVRNVPGFSGWAIDKLEATPFQPATLDGKPLTTRYSFNIKIGNASGWTRTKLRWRPLVDTETLRLCAGGNARRCFDAALLLLEGDAGPIAPDRPARILGAACEAGLAGACSMLADRFAPPAMLDALPPPPMPGSFETELICWISVQGRAHDCHAANPSVLAFLDGPLKQVRFIPARYQRVPFETEHSIHYMAVPR